MFNITQKIIQWDEKDLILETGKIARQADGAILAKMGETEVLCTVVGEKKPQNEVDFLPLTVNYQKKSFSSGRIPGGFFKREGRPSEHEILISRLIDRPLRPLFPKNFCNEVQVICTTLSQDSENPPDILALIGSSAALAISGIPVAGPIAAVRVGYKNNQLILNPPMHELNHLTLDMVIAGSQESILMVEGGASELSEEIVLKALEFGHQNLLPVIEMIQELSAECGKPRWALPEPTYDPQELKTQVHSQGWADGLSAAYQNQEKQRREQDLLALKQKIKEAPALHPYPPAAVEACLSGLEREAVRRELIQSGLRPDGRQFSEIRPIQIEVSLFKQTHGSALFTRGETQALVTTTLGTTYDEQIVETFEEEIRQKFILHYNFPPYSVNEVGRFGSPGRREIGHGKLAWRALHPLLPSPDTFPYTIRVVSEITESNGSSSMATVCGTSLALMDAGVSIDRPVAGIAMGLIQENDQTFVLSDITGGEDSLGDMDLKVSGTLRGVTAIQMDIKNATLTLEILQQALEQARVGRIFIIEEMNKVLPWARELSHHTPKIRTLMIPREKIRDIIGTKGKVIREITDKTKTKIDVDDSGKVQISAANEDAIQHARQWIESLVHEPEIGKVYNGKVVKIVDFGAFINFLGRDGLVHISELSSHRVGQVSDMLSLGDEVKVKVISFDKNKIKLSMRQVDQVTGRAL